MEIKTCEEYVLNELTETKNNLYEVGKLANELQEKLNIVATDFKYTLIQIKNKADVFNDELINKMFEKYEIK